MDGLILLPLLAATVQAGTPILYATLGEMLTERAGVLNLGVEGMMLVGALAAFWTSLTTGSPWLGLIAGGTAAALLSSIHAVVCLLLQGNQVVSGLALTIFGTGLADFWGTPYIGQKAEGFGTLKVPFLAEIPVLGRIFFQQDLLVYISLLLPLLLWLFLTRTRWGLGLRSVGEHPRAAIAAGLPVLRYRAAGILAGGFCVGLGGAYLSLAYTNIWTNGLTAGRGWIAVALVIFAFWRPERAILGAYLFGGVMAFQLRLQAMGTDLPSSLLLMLPYLLTIIVLALTSWKGRFTDAPGSLGANIEPEE
ncbi:MAG: ABC transporter permease [Thermodesulfobacteriota bacterium]